MCFLVKTIIGETKKPSRVSDGKFTSFSGNTNRREVFRQKADVYRVQFPADFQMKK